MGATTASWPNDALPSTSVCNLISRLRPSFNVERRATSDGAFCCGPGGAIYTVGGLWPLSSSGDRPRLGDDRRLSPGHGIGVKPDSCSVSGGGGAPGGEMASVIDYHHCCFGRCSSEVVEASSSLRHARRECFSREHFIVAVSQLLSWTGGCHLHTRQCL